MSDYDKDITLSDWHAIKFEKELEYDDFPDFTILLSDTAISPYRSNWYQVYHKDLLRMPKKKLVESRRVLIEVLKNAEISCKRIRRIIQSRKVPNEWLVVALHAKERELKIAARLFAMMTLEMRLYFNMTEKNLAATLFDYFPSQTMTWTEADLAKTMLNMTSINDKDSLEDFIEILISLDFSKWNQCWRFLSTFYIFEAIDQLYGTPGLYTYSHIFFEKALFYLSSSLKPPYFLDRNKEGEYTREEMIEILMKIDIDLDTIWVGQQGGCEGLRQKGWTIITEAALWAVEEITGIESCIIGQGDNQFIKIRLKMNIYEDK